MADKSPTTKLSNLFVDPYLRAVFARAEDDGLAPEFVEIEDQPSSLDGGVAEVVPTAGRRILADVEG